MSKEKTPVITSNQDWQDLIGIQFALGGSDPVIGLNCYGLVREVYRGLQIELPYGQSDSLDAELAADTAGLDWSQLEEPKPYAVALIRSEGTASMFHLGVVTPELTLLHSMPKKGVVVSPISDYSPRIIGFFAYTPGKGQRLPVAEGTSGGRLIGMVAVLALAVMTSGATSSALAAEGGIWGTAAAGGGFTASNYALMAGAMSGAIVSMMGNMVINTELPEKPDYSSYGIKWGDLWTKLEPENSARIECFMNVQTPGIWWEIDFENFDLFITGKISTLADSFINVLKTINKPVINIRINSTGGLYCEMVKIIEAIREHPSEIHTYISGSVGSAASIIALSGDTVYAAKDAFFQIHRCYPDPTLPDFPTQNADECDQYAVDQLHNKSGIPKDIIAGWTEKEWLFTAREAYALGFVDQLCAPEKWVLDPERLRLLW